MAYSTAELKSMMEKHGSTVLGVAFSQLGDRGEAEDIFQETFLLYHTKQPQLEDDRARRSWLIRTALNLCREHRRSPWRKLRSDEELDEQSITDPAEALTERELSVRSALMGLREKYRLPMWLFYYENMPAALIAEVIGIKEGAVQMRLTRARRLLKKQLETEEEQ